MSAPDWVTPERLAAAIAALEIRNADAELRQFLRERLPAAIAALESGTHTPELRQFLIDLCRHIDVDLGTERVTLEGVRAIAKVWPDPSLRARKSGPLVGRPPATDTWFAASVAVRLITHHGMRPEQAYLQVAGERPEEADTIGRVARKLRRGALPPLPIDAERVGAWALDIAHKSGNKYSV